MVLPHCKVPALNMAQSLIWDYKTIRPSPIILLLIGTKQKKKKFQTRSKTLSLDLVIDSSCKEIGLQVDSELNWAFFFAYFASLLILSYRQEFGFMLRRVTGRLLVSYSAKRTVLQTLSRRSIARSTTFTSIQLKRFQSIMSAGSEQAASAPEVPVVPENEPVGYTKKRASSTTPEPAAPATSSEASTYTGNRPDRPKSVGPKKPKAKRFKEPPAADPVSNEGVLIQDIKSMLKEQDEEVGLEAVKNDLREFFTRPRGTVHPEHRVVKARILKQSGGGDGIGLVVQDADQADAKPQVVMVPFTLPGEVVEAKIYKTQLYHFEAELLQVLEASPKRDDSLVKCRYFGKCSGCQYQMLPYAEQLEIKRQVIVNAYKHNSNLDPAVVPQILETEPSPEEYYYRTKLTPHFDVPKAGGASLEKAPPVGFGERGRKTVLDIEECAIGTSVVNGGLKSQRALLKETYKTYKKGATILLRENLVPVTPETAGTDAAATTTDNLQKVCCTSTKDIILEHVGSYKFHYASSSFFQNNNSILTAVTAHVRANLLIPATGQPPSFLVDTYCGCGLFAITCAGAARSVIGVEISQASVTFATQNAALNGLTNAAFVVGAAERIFENVGHTDPAQTAVIIDPPRKGCDPLFLNQLLKYMPAKIVYVSCNVHSQARDIGYLLNSEQGAGKYRIESIKGFDFFPQTHHVESVAVLARI